MDNSLMIAGGASVVYLGLDYGKYYCTNDNQKNEYNLSYVIPNIILVFVLTLLFFHFYDEKTLGFPTEKVSSEPWE
tara:strand:+ start:172 stop:399 length:228 start_codon:yes stop_codon:yes gene_type:complete